MHIDNDLYTEKTALWAHILECYLDRLSSYSTRIRSVFDKFKIVYEELVTKQLGALEEVHSKLDYELGDNIIDLYQEACTIPAEKMTQAYYEALVRQCSRLLRLQHLDSRLKPLLGSASFAEELFDCIVVIARPQRAFDTVVRAARSFPLFATVKMYRGPPARTPGLQNASYLQDVTEPKVSTPDTETPLDELPTVYAKFQGRAPMALSPSSSGRTRCSGEAKNILRSTTTLSSRMTPKQSPSTSWGNSSSTSSKKSAEGTTPSSSLSKHPSQAVHSESATGYSSDPTAEFFRDANHYLPPHERNTGFKRLEPQAKRNTFLLVASILSGRNPLPEWKAYHVFGYPACRTYDEEQSLGGIYRAILEESESKPRIFQQLWKALEENNVVRLIDEHEYTLFRREIPSLERFFSTRPGKRQTVWLLVQFIRSSGNTDPPPDLRLDYGFDRCRMREQVAHLKDLYVKILDVYHPMDLHKACIAGQLLELAMEAYPGLSSEHHRMLRGRSVLPGTGFEGDAPAPILGGGVFKNKAK